MAAIDLIGPNDSPLLLREVYAGGDPGPIVGALAHVPELCEIALPFIGGALGPSAVSERLKEIVILRTSAQMECRYCTEAHTVVAADAGLSKDELRVLRCELDQVDLFATPGEQAVIAWVDALALGRGRAPQELVQALKEHYADHIIVELTVTAGTTIMLNRFASGLGLPTSVDTLERLVELGFATSTDAETPIEIGSPA